MVKVLRYFTRGSPPNPYASDEEDDMNICSIQRRKQDWFPCVSNKGEGIFFSIREDLLKEWEQRPEVQKRCGALFESFNEWAKTREWDIPETRRPRYVLLHTLAHALIRELSISSGYNEASIAERIYEGNNHNAILLFTASSSSDGSLGGLVRKAEQGQFLSILENAIQKSKYCSRDPLCIEDDPYEKKQRGFPVHTRLNGAACYACTLIPETSCNEFNRLLDRKFLFDDEIGTGGTMIAAADAITKQGSTDIYAVATHGVLSGDTSARLAEVSHIKEVVITDTVPLSADKVNFKMKVISVAPLLGEAIKRIHEGRSVGELFIQ